MQDHTGTCASQMESDRSANSLRRSGHQRHVAIQTKHRCFPFATTKNPSLRNSSRFDPVYRRSTGANARTLPEGKPAVVSSCTDDTVESMPVEDGKK
jgi:hypothetical protein